MRGIILFIPEVAVRWRLRGTGSELQDDEKLEEASQLGENLQKMVQNLKCKI